MRIYPNFQQDANGGTPFRFSDKKSVCPRCGKNNFHAITHVSGVLNCYGGGKCFSTSCNIFIKPEAGARSAGNVYQPHYKSSKLPASPASNSIEPPYSAYKTSDTYIYKDEEGKALYDIHRMEADTSRFKKPDGSKYKTFRMYKPNSKMSIGKETRRVLYQLPEVLQAVRDDKTIFIVEGEKDVNTLLGLGLPATCNVGGTGGTWLSEYSEMLRDASVVILPDNDEPGLKHSEKIANALLGIAASVKIVTLPDLPLKGDVTDFIERGGTVDDILAAVNSTPAILHPIVNTQELSPEEEFIEQFTLDNAPEIPQHIYDSLPPFLKELCDTFTQPFEKGVFLTAALPVLASQMPNVVTRNADNFHSLDLYVAIVARAGSGKGKAEFAFRLASHTDTYILNTSERSLQQWRAENNVKAKKSKADESDNELPYEPMPIVRGLAIPANTSATHFIRKLRANDGRGLIKESEIDNLVGTLKQDWGALIDPLLRQAFHHEMYSLSRAQSKDTDDSEVRIEKPQLSVALTGTPNQMVRLLGKGGIENGLYSRFAFYCLDAPDEWQSRRPSEKFDEREALFTVAAGKMFSLWEMLSKRTQLEVKLTDAHFDLIDFTFAGLRSEWRDRNSDIMILTQRSALIAQRIIGVLTVIRNIDGELYRREYLTPIDEDVQTGIELAVLYFDHAARFAVDKLQTVLTANADLKQRAFQMQEQGLSYRAIAKVLGVTHPTVSGWLRSGNSGKDLPLTTLTTQPAIMKEQVETFRDSSGKHSPSYPITKKELDEGFLGNRTVAKLTLLRAILGSRNIPGSEAQKLVNAAIVAGVIRDTQNDTYERLI